jgi:hypothetical protein
LEDTVAAGRGALNFAVLVDDVDTAVTAMRKSGIPAQRHTVRIRIGPLTIPAYTLGWPTAGPPWAPFVITYHPILRHTEDGAAQRAAAVSYRLTRNKLLHAPRQVPILHVGPRGDELPDSVDDLDCVHYFDQVHYGMYLRAALLEAVIRTSTANF